jgi:glycosyltransferase involved in cell wall biosynthesis
MKISVITVNYNNVDGLQLTIDSVLSQVADSSYNLEYIVIDGGSTDTSVELLNRYSSSIDFWISEKDRGVYHAMNKGILASTGSYLVFLNSGDYFFHKNILRECVVYVRSSLDADIYYGDTFIELNHVRKRHIHPAELDLSFLRKDTINHQSSLIRRELFDEFGLYPEKYRLAADYWLYLVAFLKGKSYKYIDSILVFYDTNGVSASNNFSAYTEERNLVWCDLMVNTSYSILLTREFDKILKDNHALQSVISRKIIKIALLLDKSLSIFIGMLKSVFSR